MLTRVGLLVIDMVVVSVLVALAGAGLFQLFPAVDWLRGGQTQNFWTVVVLLLVRVTGEATWGGGPARLVFNHRVYFWESKTWTWRAWSSLLRNSWLWLPLIFGQADFGPFAFVVGFSALLRRDSRTVTDLLGGALAPAPCDVPPAAGKPGECSPPRRALGFLLDYFVLLVPVLFLPLEAGRQASLALVLVGLWRLLGEVGGVPVLSRRVLGVGHTYLRGLPLIAGGVLGVAVAVTFWENVLGVMLVYGVVLLYLPTRSGAKGQAAADPGESGGTAAVRPGA